MLTISDFQLYLFIYRKCDNYKFFGAVAVFTVCINSVFVDTSVFTACVDRVCLHHVC